MSKRPNCLLIGALAVAAAGYASYKVTKSVQTLQALNPESAPGKWTISNIPYQSGKVVVVTGANSGLGLETARALAAKGAQVVMACRNQKKAKQAAQAILAEFPQANLDLISLDLADLASVRAFADNFNRRYQKLDALCNNAGVMAIPYRQTADGFETQFGVNHLGHFALTGLLLDTLKATPGARVVTVSSMAHRLGKIDFDNLNGEKSYRRWSAYGQSKLANLLFTYELQRRFDAAGITVLAMAAHPGWSNTNLQYAGPQMDGSAFMLKANRVANNLFAQSQRMGALPQLYALTASNVAGGAYYGPDGFRGTRGYPTRANSTPRSHNQADAARLWEVSEALTGVLYRF